MSTAKTSYLLRDIPRDLWEKFKANIEERNAKNRDQGKPEITIRSEILKMVQRAVTMR